MLRVACFDLGVYGSLRQALRVDARSSLTLRYRYRYANASSFMPGNPSTGLDHRFPSTFKKLTLIKSFSLN
ncbi:hypothetical protein IQ275_14900 [Nostoc sp. LEGE 12450]|nr:hypothetical protein [Nostoc sp. LEGE 12450]